LSFGTAQPLPGLVFLRKSWMLLDCDDWKIRIIVGKNGAKTAVENAPKAPNLQGFQNLGGFGWTECKATFQKFSRSVPYFSYCVSKKAFGAL
jgi:hypothetical protein